jgi:hypothetical protein
MVLTLKHITRRLVRDIPPAAALCLALLTAAAASAQTACVQCSGPEQVYRCEATSDQPMPNQAVGLFCVARIASEHAHESCAVQRGATVCVGLAVTYVYDQNIGTSAPAADGDGGDAPNRTANGEPATLGEFTKDTVSASAKSAKAVGQNIGSAASKAGTATTDAIKGAGNAIGNATKKTLKCLGSALNDC